jgi:hypothetical protein
MTERKERLKRDVEKLRRHSDDVLMAIVKMAKTYRAEGFEREAVQCERCAEFIQALDNPYFMAQISLG